MSRAGFFADTRAGSEEGTESSMPDFVKIDRSEVPKTKRYGGSAVMGRTTRALLEGETIWIAGSPEAFRPGRSITLKKKGLRLRTRKMSRDGVEGFAAWTEPLNGTEPR